MYRRWTRLFIVFNAHMTSAAKRDEVGGLVCCFPISGEVPVWPYVVYGVSWLSTRLTNAIIALTDFLSSSVPVRSSVQTRSTPPVWVMVSSCFRCARPIKVGALLRTTVLNAAFECSHFFTALFAVPGYLSTALKYFNAMLRLSASKLTPTLIRTKYRLPISPGLKLFSTPFAGKNRFLAWISSLCKRPTFWRTKTPYSLGAAHKFSLASFTSISFREVLTNVCHTASLVLARARLINGARRLACGACQYVIGILKPADYYITGEVFTV